MRIHCNNLLWKLSCFNSFLLLSFIVLVFIISFGFEWCLNYNNNMIQCVSVNPCTIDVCIDLQNRYVLYRVQTIRHYISQLLHCAVLISIWIVIMFDWPVLLYRFWRFSLLCDGKIVSSSALAVSVYESTSVRFMQTYLA